MNKIDLEQYIGQKITFVVVDRNPDLKVKFVKMFPDYTVKISTSSSYSATTIRVQDVRAFEDVKLQEVDGNADFELYID